LHSFIQSIYIAPLFGTCSEAKQRRINQFAGKYSCRAAGTAEVGTHSWWRAHSRWKAQQLEDSMLPERQMDPEDKKPSLD